MSEQTPQARLIAQWRHAALVAGQFSVECAITKAHEHHIAATEAMTLARCADELSALLPQPAPQSCVLGTVGCTVEHVERCLGCNKPTASSDCGCPAGTGWTGPCLPQPAEQPHQWTRRQGREAVYDCPVCGMWTANLPLYKNDPCEKAIAPTPAPTYRVEQIAEALRAVKIVVGVTSEGELRAYRQPRQRGR